MHVLAMPCLIKSNVSPTISAEHMRALLQLAKTTRRLTKQGALPPLLHHVDNTSTQLYTLLNLS